MTVCDDCGCVPATDADLEGTRAGERPDLCWWSFLGSHGEIALSPLAAGVRAIATRPQPPPKDSPHPDVWPLVVADMQARNAEGIRRYGTPLRAHNGRDALVDAYQEVLDAALYLRQAIYERDEK